MAAVVYKRVDPRNSPAGDCPVCFEKPKDAIAHDNGGELHPICAKCLKVWALIHSTCPTCRQPIDLDSVSSFKEKVLHRIKKIKPFAVNAASAALGTMMIGTIAATGEISLSLIGASAAVLNGLNRYRRGPGFANLRVIHGDPIDRIRESVGASLIHPNVAASIRLLRNHLNQWPHISIRDPIASIRGTMTSALDTTAAISDLSQAMVVPIWEAGKEVLFLGGFGICPIIEIAKAALPIITCQPYAVAMGISAGLATIPIMTMLESVSLIGAVHIGAAIAGLLAGRLGYALAESAQS